MRRSAIRVLTQMPSVVFCGVRRLQKKGPTRRQSQRPRPSCLVLTKAESNEAAEPSTEACTSHARRGRGSSLTLGERDRSRGKPSLTDAHFCVRKRVVACIDSKAQHPRVARQKTCPCFEFQHSERD